MFRPIHRVDKELDMYHQMFMSVVRYNCKEDEYYQPNQLIVDFSPDSDWNNLGTCQTGLSRSEIHINKDEWVGLSDDDKFQLMMHEETHCVLKLDHIDDDGHYMSPAMHEIPWYKTVYQVMTLVRSVCTKWK